jgi:hypothetical protein
MKNKPPYDVAQEPGGRAFLAFETSAGVVLLPWHSLRAVRLAPDNASLVFEYGNATVELLGSGLAILAELAGATRLKSVRQGETDETRILSVRLLGGES